MQWIKYYYKTRVAGIKFAYHCNKNFPCIRYINTTFDFSGNSLLEKEKYLVAETSWFCVE